MAVTGKYDVDYRIVIACRDGRVYTIKNGEVTGTVIELESAPVLNDTFFHIMIF